MELAEQLKQKIAAYKPSDQVVDLLGKTRVLLLVAITGGGKDTIKHRLLDTGEYHHIISHTTRSPRENHGELEKDGVEYHFIDLPTAERMIGEGSYIEVDIYAANVYGTGMSDIAQAYQEGKIATTDMTIEGALHYLALAPSVKAVFLLPPNYEVWMDRLMARYNGGSDRQDIHLRMQEAVDEIEIALRSKNLYIVVNDNLEKTVELVNDIAHGKPVEPHHHKAIEIAEQLLSRLKTEMAK